MGKGIKKEDTTQHGQTVDSPCDQWTEYDYNLNS